MKNIIKLFLPVLALLWTMPSFADGEMKPFILASKQSGDQTSLVKELRSKLTTAGFEIVGEYSPYASATILAISNNSLKRAAAASEHGGYGAAQRVTVTKNQGELQVAYTNPVYMAHVYRLPAKLEDVGSALAAALGDMGEYGPEEGLSAEQLSEYHYKFLMPYLDDAIQLAKFPSHELAVAAIEKGLAAGNSGTSKVYRIDMGNDKTLFGVALSKGMSSDEYIMSEIDFKPTRSTGHLPYEMLVDGNTVYTLPAEFRIAINFPDLSMMGSNSFMNIMSSPDAIKSALAHAAGINPQSEEYGGQ
jgi:hypothetical protein